MFCQRITLINILVKKKGNKKRKEKRKNNRKNIENEFEFRLG